MNNNFLQLLIDIANKSDLEKKWKADASSMLVQYNIDKPISNKMLAGTGTSLNVVISKDWTKPAPGSPA